MRCAHNLGRRGFYERSTSGRLGSVISRRMEDVAQIVTLGPMRERLSLMAKLLCGLPNLAAGAMAIPLLINMPKFYADVIAVPMAFLAVAYRCDALPGRDYRSFNRV